MRQVTVEAFVAATPAEVSRALAPGVVVEYEGSFDVLEIDERDEATFVTAGARGGDISLRFERRGDGLRYEQVGDAGPFEELWTDLSWEPEDEGTRVAARSGVSRGRPLSALTDRVAAWKRRAELDRALDRLADDLE